ncbi:MAG TPA: ABC transporter substrate-binding protein [Burkholderiales bacterium]
MLAAPRVRAQQRGKVYTLGWLGSGIRPGPGTPNVSYDAFVLRLRELGYVEGRNLVVEQRFGEGKTAQLDKRTSELVALKVDVILATTTTAAAAASKATRSIPIVMGSAANPVAAGLLSNLSHPGGNITGLTLETADTTAKRLELLKAAIPPLKRIAAMHPASIRNFPVVSQWLKANEAAGELLGVTVTPIDLPIDAIDRWEQVFRKAASDGLSAATLLETPTYLGSRARLAELCLKYRMAAVFPFREQAEAGGLMAYGADLPDLYRRAAEYVDKILKGAKPGDLPVEQPTKFALVVNLRTAKALGLTIAPSLLLRADHVIQ